MTYPRILQRRGTGTRTQHWPYRCLRADKACGHMGCHLYTGWWLCFQWSCMICPTSFHWWRPVKKNKTNMKLFNIKTWLWAVMNTTLSVKAILTSPMHPSNSMLTLAGLGKMSMLGTPPRYMGVWILRPWALPGEDLVISRAWSTFKEPSLWSRSATTRCHWPRDTGSWLRRTAWPENTGGGGAYLAWTG